MPQKGLSMSKDNFIYKIIKFILTVLKEYRYI